MPALPPGRAPHVTDAALMLGWPNIKAASAERPVRAEILTLLALPVFVLALTIDEMNIITNNIGLPTFFQHHHMVIALWSYSGPEMQNSWANSVDWVISY